MNKKKRIVAGVASLAMVASIALAMPLGASAVTYDGIITTDNAKNSALTGSVTYRDAEGSEQTIRSYNATELKKILIVKDDVDIPKVSFTYTASAGTAIAATETTHEVLAGLNPANIKWVEEPTKTIEKSNDAFYMENVGEHSVGTAGAEYTLQYAAQDVHDETGGKITAATDTLTAAGSDNVLLNNTSSTDDTSVYYAIKTMRLDFTGCGFTEPGIYRYVITESNTKQSGIAYDTTLTRTIDVYVEDASYTPYTSDGNDPAAYIAGTAVNKLRIAGYVMYNGTIEKAPDIVQGTPSDTSANALEDDLENTMTGDNALNYGIPNGYEVAGAAKSEGFKNTYVTHDLTFSKTVTGNQGSKDKYFAFTVKIENAVAGTVYAVSYADDGNDNTTDGDADKNISANPNNATTCITSDVTQPAKLTVGENGTVTQTFYLQHGQKIVIRGLAKGTKYTITEAPEDYTPSAVATAGDDKNTGDAVEAGSAIMMNNNAMSDDYIKGDAVIDFTNTRQGTIPTGVLLSIAAPAGVCIVVIAGIVYLLIKDRRRKTEEE